MNEGLEDANHQIEQLKAENHAFANVIAMLNRDGGHRIAQVGAKQAAKEAMERLHELLQAEAERDEARGGTHPTKCVKCGRDMWTFYVGERKTCGACLVDELEAERDHKQKLLELACRDSVEDENRLIAMLGCKDQYLPDENDSEMIWRVLGERMAELTALRRAVEDAVPFVRYVHNQASHTWYSRAIAWLAEFGPKETKP